MSDTRTEVKPYIFEQGCIYQGGYKMDVHDGAKFVTEEYHNVAMAEHEINYDAQVETIAARDRRIEELEEDLEVEREELREALLSQEDDERTIAETRKRIEELESETNDLRHNKSLAEQSLSFMKAELAEARREIGKQQDKMEMQQDQLSGLSVDLAEARKEVERLTISKGMVAATAAKYLEELATARAVNAKLREQRNEAVKLWWDLHNMWANTTKSPLGLMTEEEFSVETYDAELDAIEKASETT